MAEVANLFGGIFVGTRSGATQVQLKVHSHGLTWKKTTGGRTEEIRPADMEALSWMHTGPTRGFMLGVRRKDGTTVNFMGFKTKDQEALKQFASNIKLELQELELSSVGRNWGRVVVHGSSLQFLAGSGFNKVVFEVPLSDVAQAQQAKDEVVMEFHTDDTAGNDQEDTLVEMAFHIPPTNEDYQAGEGEDNNAAKVLFEQVVRRTEAGTATSDDAMCIFDGVMLMVPRGRFEVEMHGHFLKLVGQTQDFKIRYSSITHLFVLPKHTNQTKHTNHTLVVISLEHPLRKGQTYYQHLLCSFPSDEETNVELDISDEQLEAINAKTERKDGFKLEKKMSGPAADVFAKLLKGLSRAVVVSAAEQKDGFRNDAGGYAARCSFKADDGLLFPLRRYFFYVHKPPFYIAHEDIDSVEFARQGGGVLQSSIRTFDLVIRTKGSQEFQFRNIQRSEWKPLFDFISSRNLHIENLAQAQQGPGAAQGLQFDDDIDPGRAAVAIADDDDEDEDFAGEEDSGSGSDSGSDSGASVEMVDEAELEAEETGATHSKKKKSSEPRESLEPAPKKPKAESKPRQPKQPKVPKAPKAPKGGEAGPSGEGAPAKGKKEKKKKKDPNAPKKAISAYFYYMQANRERVLRDNPGIKFGEVGKIIGEEWKKLTTEDKAPYEVKARADKERYAQEMSSYKASGGTAEAAEGDDE